MSQQITTCPKCKGRFCIVVKIHNPETTNMNANASLRCETCSHEWEGRVTSPHQKKRWEQGWIR